VSLLKCWLGAPLLSLTTRPLMRFVAKLCGRCLMGAAVESKNDLSLSPVRRTLMLLRHHRYSGRRARNVGIVLFATALLVVELQPTVLRQGFAGGVAEPGSPALARRAAPPGEPPHRAVSEATERSVQPTGWKQVDPRLVSAPISKVSGAGNWTVRVTSSLPRAVGANHAPTWVENASTNLSMSPGGSLVRLASSDPDGDPVTYSVASGAFPGTLLLAADGSFSGTAFSAGVFTTSVSAIDSHGAVTLAQVHVTVTNALPRLSAAASNSHQTVGAGASLVALVAFDPNLEPVLFSLKSGQLPTGIALASDGTFTGSAAAAGQYVATIQISDSVHAQITATLHVNVRPSTDQPVSTLGRVTSQESRVLPTAPATSIAVTSIAMTSLPVTSLPMTTIGPTVTAMAGVTMVDGVTGVRSRLDENQSTTPTTSAMAD
jgi:large repetitive protein